MNERFMRLLPLYRRLQQGMAWPADCKPLVRVPSGCCSPGPGQEVVPVIRWDYNPGGSVVAGVYLTARRDAARVSNIMPLQWRFCRYNAATSALAETTLCGLMETLSGCCKDAPHQVTCRSLSWAYGNDRNMVPAPAEAVMLVMHCEDGEFAGIGIIAPTSFSQQRHVPLIVEREGKDLVMLCSSVMAPCVEEESALVTV